MHASHRPFVFGLAVLLAAATAAADTAITAEEVISCWVQSADTVYVRLKLPGGGIRMLATRDVYELRLSDSSRVAELAAQLPGARVLLDSGQPVPTLAVRARALQPQRAGRRQGFSAINVHRNAGFGPIAGEAGAGLVCGAALGFGTFLCVGFAAVGSEGGFEPPAQRMGAVLVAIPAGVAGLALGTTIGTYAVGNAYDQGGSRAATFLGALTGTAAGVVMVYLGGYRGWPGFALAAMLPVIGAVAGYNLSWAEPMTGGVLPRQLGYPSVGLLPSSRRLSPPSFDLRLLRVNF